MKIAILGAGAWGTALAVALAERQQVLLWGRNRALIDTAALRRENNTALPGIALPAKLALSADFDAAIAHCTVPVGDDALLIDRQTLGLPCCQSTIQTVHVCESSRLQTGCRPRGLHAAGAYYYHRARLEFVDLRHARGEFLRRNILGIAQMAGSEFNAASHIENQCFPLIDQLGGLQGTDLTATALQ